MKHIIFVGAFNPQLRKQASLSVLKEAIAQEVIDAGVEVSEWREARAVTQRCGTKSAVIEKGFALLFEDEESCRRAAWHLKNGLRRGAYTIKLNEELPLQVFRLWFDDDQDGVNNLHKGAQTWAGLMRNQSDFVSVMIFETPRGICVMGSNSPYRANDAQAWKKAVMSVADNADNVTLPDFYDK